MSKGHRAPKEIPASASGLALAVNPAHEPLTISRKAKNFRILGRLVMCWRQVR